MANIKVVADRTMNVFFQDYANTAEFFDIDDFIYYVGAAYSGLLGQEWKQEYGRMVQEGEQGVVSFSHDWLQTVVVDREKGAEGYFIKLIEPVMSFPYDKRDTGIQNIFPLDKQFNGELIRSSIDDIWKDEYLPLTNKTFWALLKDTIYLKCNMGNPPAKFRVVFVPGVSEDLDIPASREMAVIAGTVDMMRKASANYIVKETSNQNLNEAPATDFDKNLTKGQ